MRIRAIVWFFLCAAALFGLPAGALAEPGHDSNEVPAATSPPHGVSAGRADAAHGGEHGPKPALLDWDIGSAFWSIIVFLILLIVLRFTAWKPILTALQQREHFISQSIEDAKRERAEAKKMMEDYAARVARSREEASAIVEEGRRDAEEVRKRIHAEAQKETEELLARAQREIKVAQETAASELYTRAVDLASDLAGRVLRRQVTIEDHQRLLSESLAALGKSEH